MPAQAADLLKRFNNEEALKGRDVSLFGYSNFSEVQRTAVIARNGPVVMLERAIDTATGMAAIENDATRADADSAVGSTCSRNACGAR